MLAAPRHGPMSTRSATALSVRTGDPRWARKPGAWPSHAVLFGMVLLVRPTSAQVATPSIDDLIAKAIREGSVRVSVELKTDPNPSREAIAAAQDLVLQELAGTRHRVVRRFTTIPFLGLSISANALQRLAGSLFVGGIREDRPLRPQ